ncbi:MAG: ferrochelatase [Pseudomonadales bacterium]
MSRYSGDPDFRHDSSVCLGILLTNLGTPNAPNASALRKYLGEFLADPRVIETPKFIWWFILHGIILRTRPRKSAKMYAKVWSEAGSPLLRISMKQQQAVQAELDKRLAGPVKVVLAMRYGDPSIKSGMEQLRQAGARRIVILPLYPQYSAATSASTFDAVSDVLKSWRWLPDIRFISHYHTEPGYIEAIAARIRAHWQNEGRADRILFSYHGIPKHYFLAGDPYHCECHATSRLIADALELQDDQWMTTFQSRFGPREWLRPYTDETLAGFPKQGIKSVQMVCPGFSADCLETLEENNIQNRNIFISNGGEQFTYVPALNDYGKHIEFLADLIGKHIHGWPEADAHYSSELDSQARAKRKQRALAMGAEQ